MFVEYSRRCQVFRSCKAIKKLKNKLLLWVSQYWLQIFFVLYSFACYTNKYSWWMLQRERIKKRFFAQCLSSTLVHSWAASCSSTLLNYVIHVPSHFSSFAWNNYSSERKIIKFSKLWPGILCFLMHIHNSWSVVAALKHNKKPHVNCSSLEHDC